MSQKFGYLLLILLSFSVFSQEKKVTRDEVLNLLTTSDSLMFKAKYKQSLLLSNEALKKAIQLKNDNLIALSYNSIAGNYEEILEEDKALDFYKKAVFYSEKARNDTLKIWFYNNIGNIYLYRKNNIDVGIEYYDKSLEFSNRLKDTASSVLTKLNLSWAYFQKKNYTKAIQNLDFAEKHIDFMRFPDTETYLNLLLGMKFSHLKENDKAKLYYQKAIDISIENQLDSYLSDSYEQYANHLFEIGDYKNAYLTLDKHEDVKDRVFRSENIKNAELVALKIELDESKKEIQEIKKERI